LARDSRDEEDKPNKKRHTRDSRANATISSKPTSLLSFFIELQCEMEMKRPVESLPSGTATFERCPKLLLVSTAEGHVFHAFTTALTPSRRDDVCERTITVLL
jgi:hypothetical protein